MKKTLYLLLFLLLFSVIFALCASAETADSTTSAPLADTASPESETANTENAVFTNAVGDFLSKHAEKILCVLACLASLVPTLLYKTGLLPLLRAGISALSDVSGKTSQKAEEFSALAEEKLAALKEGAEAAVLASQSALTVLSETEKRLAALESALNESVRDKKKTTAALQTETELLFRMLQCVNLPQAQKDLMSERYLALQKTLEEN